MYNDNDNVHASPGHFKQDRRIVNYQMRWYHLASLEFGISSCQPEKWETNSTALDCQALIVIPSREQSIVSSKVHRDINMQVIDRSRVASRVESSRVETTLQELSIWGTRAPSSELHPAQLQAWIEYLSLCAAVPSSSSSSAQLGSHARNINSTRNDSSMFNNIFLSIWLSSMKMKKVQSSMVSFGK